MVVTTVLLVEADISSGHQLLLHGHALILLRRLVTRLTLVLGIAISRLLRRPRLTGETGLEFRINGL